MRKYKIKRSRFNLKGIGKGLLIGLALYIGLELYGASQLDWGEVKAGSEIVKNEPVDLLKMTVEVKKDKVIKKRIPNRDEGWEKYLESLGLEKEKEEWVKRIVHCESRGNPLAENSQEIVVNGISYGHASGLGQFLPSTWARGEGYLGRDMDIWNEYDQVDMLIEFYNRGQQHEWACD